MHYDSFLYSVNEAHPTPHFSIPYTEFTRELLKWKADVQISAFCSGGTNRSVCIAKSYAAVTLRSTAALSLERDENTNYPST